MADPNHIEWLGEGIDAWNSRRALSNFEPDLSGADLTQTNLQHFNLENVNLSRADLTRANLQYLKLENANLEKAKLKHANLLGAELRGAKLIQADLRKVSAPMARFDDAVLFGARLQHARLMGADFSNAILQRANLTNADLSLANLTGTDLRFAVVAGARLEDSILSSANTLCANLWRAVLYREGSAPTNLQSQAEQITIASVSDLLVKIQRLETAMLLYFRGEQRYGWRPIPSIFRAGLADVEDKMLIDLIARRPEEMGGAKTALEQLLLAQHYGLSTRLLDVTRNPLVALFFACEERVEHDGCLRIFAIPESLIKTFDSDTISIIASFVKLPIRDKTWLLSREGLHPQRPFSAYYNYGAIMDRLYQKIREGKPHFEKRIDMKDLYGVFVFEPQQQNERVRAQSSAFLVSAFQEHFDLPKGMEWNGGVRPYGHYTLSIPSDCKESILNELRLMDITRQSLFPGLESSATDVMRRYQRLRDQEEAQSNEADTE